MLHSSLALGRANERAYWYSLIAPSFPFILFATYIALNPVGFIGGDSDDFQYLEAARCWVENGACLPQDHWQGRWTIIAPLALILFFLGETRWTVAIPTLTASLICLVLVRYLGHRLFGVAAARISTALLAMAPVFALQALDPNVDSVELMFILCGFAALISSRGDGHLLWPALCGLSFALALQTRETALAVAPAALFSFAAIHPLKANPKPWLIAAGCFIVPFAIEAIIFAAETGDPLWRRQLSIGHAQLATTELQGRSHVSGLPFFNRELIENWRHEPGLSLYWAIDGLVNLIINPRTGCLFLLLPFLWAKCRSYLRGRERRAVRYLAFTAIIQASLLIYVFAVDPKPRIMLPALAATALALGPPIAALMRENPVFARSLLTGVALISAVNVLSGYRSDRAELIATRWLERDAGRIETARQTFRRLIFVPESRALAPISSERNLLLLQVNNSCTGWLEKIGIDRDWLQVERSASLGTYPSWIINRQAHLCLFRYSDQRAHGALLRALGPQELAF